MSLVNKVTQCYIMPEPAEAGRWLQGIAQPGDAILFKGSRGTRVEKALESFLGEEVRS